jgi:hypothetical protein
MVKFRLAFKPLGRFAGVPDWLEKPFAGRQAASSLPSRRKPH